jgi:phage shock protein C
LTPAIFGIGAAPAMKATLQTVHRIDAIFIAARAISGLRKELIIVVNHQGAIKMSLPKSYPTTRWVRSPDGKIAGVCEGIAKRLGIDSWILRVILILGTFCFFSGPFLYLGLAISLPREDRIPEAYDGMVLGVCSKISRRSDIEVGIVRFGMLFLLLTSMGFVGFAYLVLYFVMPDADQVKPN